MTDRPFANSNLLKMNQKRTGTRSTKVSEIECYGRNASGTLLGGIVTFEDGKVWAWHWSSHDNDFYFTIDSGVPSQWSCGNFGRMIAPPKRVAALKAKLIELGEVHPESKET